MIPYPYAYKIMIGLIAGLLCALGGALKDSPHEGFKPLTFTRSPLVATFWGIVSCFLIASDNFFLLLAFCGYFERITVEGWKILRGIKPGKFDWR